MNMTRDEIRAMPAGREMDVLVGIYILKKTQVEINRGLDAGHNQYSTDISAAWEVVEEINTKYRLELVQLGFPPRVWRATFFDAYVSEGLEAKAEVASLAICRAALLTVTNPP